MQIEVTIELLKKQDSGRGAPLGAHPATHQTYHAEAYPQLGYNIWLGMWDIGDRACGEA